jgi:hypothetical protein
MKKTIRLTEADLTRIVKRVIREQHNDDDMDELTLWMNYLSNNKDFMFDVVKSDLSDEQLFHIEGADRIATTQILKNYLKGNDKIRFIAVTDCEYLDCSKIDFCQFPNLVVVNLSGTPNNFEETQGDCYEKFGDGYTFNR